VNQTTFLYRAGKLTDELNKTIDLAVTSEEKETVFHVVQTGISEVYLHFIHDHMNNLIKKRNLAIKTKREGSNITLWMAK